MQIPGLYHFFRRQVQTGLSRINLLHPPAVEYVSDMLTRFSRTSALYPYRDHDGRQLEHIIDLQLLQSAGTVRDISITRHIGEYTLFMSGLFRERLLARQELGYYEAHGRGAFGLCASHAVHSERQHTFGYLSDHFGSISKVLAQMCQRPIRFGIDTTSPLAALWLR